MPTTGPIYKLPHEVLPYDIERSLPIDTVCVIYSFLRQNQSNTAAKKERLEISINHKLSAGHELLQKRKELCEAKLKQQQQFIAQLEKIIRSLEKMVATDQTSDGSLRYAPPS